MELSQKLVLLTAEFPFGKGETFLESELPILCQHFDEVKIYTTKSANKNAREVPNNCQVNSLQIKSSGLKVILQIFNPIDWKEIFITLKNYKDTKFLGSLKTMLVSLMRAKSIARKLKTELNGISEKNTTLYSYWCDDSALALAILKAEFPKSKMISRAHGWDVYFEPSKFQYLPFRRFIADKLDFICPVSKFGADYIKNRWNIKDASKLKVAYLGVKSAMTIPVKTDNSHFIIVSCSNCIPLKRVHLLIEALAQINKNVHWFHFGDGPLLEELNAKAKKELPAQVKFDFKGRISNEELMLWYNANTVDLFINVSESEGLPVSIMEATSYGIPILATNVGGVSEIVEDGVNGNLLKADVNSVELVEAIKIILNLPKDHIRMMGEASLNIWEEKFNAERNFGEFCGEVLKCDSKT
ncbi:MAG: glycosyltransferase [Bacteroidetes bacterium]|nr:glycosyltransferase [Bacteroidota bacterium]